jgi:hypothetical protein
MDATRSRALRRAPAIALCAICLAALAPAPAFAIFRAFSSSSPWNQTAVPAASTNPWEAQFADTPGFTMRLSGTPENPAHGAPVYFARPGDPVAPVSGTDPGLMPDGPMAWDGKPVPVPSGVMPASSLDGHLTVVSWDRRMAWDFYGCTQAGVSGYIARVVVQWDLTGQGYSPSGDENSARGSGAPLISTSLRAEEAVNGLRHALGITVPRVSRSYMLPATHSDGLLGPDAIRYGMRFVLRPDYTLPFNATRGMINVVYALKTYGAFVVDQGADFEMDADFTHPELWQEAGLATRSFGFTGADFLPAVPGTPPFIPTLVSPARIAVRPQAVVLRVNRRPVRVRHRFHLYGRARGDLTGASEVRFAVRVRGAWRHLTAQSLRADGSFTATARLRLAPRRGQGPRALEVGGVRLGAARKVAVRATVPRVGRSDVELVRLKR